jgi:hypothetical protein
MALALILSVLALIYLVVTFLLPFYVRRTMVVAEKMDTKSMLLDSKIAAIEQLQKAQLAALNSLIEIQWEIKNQTPNTKQ